MNELIITMFGSILSAVLVPIVLQIYYKIFPKIDPKYINNKDRVLSKIQDNIIDYENLLNKFYGYKFKNFKITGNIQPLRYTTNDSVIQLRDLINNIMNIYKSSKSKIDFTMLQNNQITDFEKFSEDFISITYTDNTRQDTELIFNNLINKIAEIKRW